MSAKSSTARYSQSRTDTLIGAGVRVEGRIAFTGVLRIQGDVLGDVSCGADSRGMIVVDKPGNVTGTIRAPNIVIGGRVSGPLHSTESIEIQQGAGVAGDIFYRQLDIHAGGVIEGLLTQEILTDGDQSTPESRSQDADPPAGSEYRMPAGTDVPAGSSFGWRMAVGRTLGAAVALVVAVASLTWILRDPLPASPPAGDIASKADSRARGDAAAQPAPVDSGKVQEGSRTAAGDTAPVVPVSAVETRIVAQEPAVTMPENNPEAVVLVQGVNPAKPPAVLLVIGKEPSVLFRKKRGQPGEGTRIEVPRGASKNIAIPRNELFRVASGRDIDIYYQGRKVAPKTIESGAWMSFVPQGSGTEGD